MDQHTVFNLQLQIVHAQRTGLVDAAYKGHTALKEQNLQFHVIRASIATKMNWMQLVALALLAITALYQLCFGRHSVNYTEVCQHSTANECTLVEG